MVRLRVDKLLVERGLAESRPKAHAMVLAGQVYLDGQRIEKPGHAIPADGMLEVKAAGPRYVSRGGIKLAAALDYFGVIVSGRTCLDVGASTGGFTDCLLQRGAARVVALDVGRHQLAWRLRQDPRVEILDGVNARELKASDFDGHFDLVTVDVAFISLKKILPAVIRVASPAAPILALIKPQFEVGRGRVGAGGIVRNSEQHRQIVDTFCDDPSLYPGAQWRGVMRSPITGADGNVEFFLYLRVEGPAPAAD
ncbi:MAG: TlyA family RNA methyltransferase [Acidobacteria bacterium]|nr:TlyA family RNA methyltransferase [Acidobacteriota bacterium]